MRRDVAAVEVNAEVLPVPGTFVGQPHFEKSKRLIARVAQPIIGAHSELRSRSGNIAEFDLLLLDCVAGAQRHGAGRKEKQARDNKCCASGALLETFHQSEEILPGEAVQVKASNP